MTESERALNVVLAPGSEAHRHTHPPAPQPSDGPVSHDLAPGFQPQPAWNLTDFGGKTISTLTFVNRYVGGAAAWSASDMSNIDHALSSAFSDAGLESVIAQYYSGPISSTMLPSAVDPNPVPATVYKDTAEALATQLHADGAIGAADPGSTVINILLPQGIVLSDGSSPGSAPQAERRVRGVIKLDAGDAADSKHGLGGYHGSVHLADGTEIYYAVGVYSEGDNGIVAFDQPWKNVVATFYHELNEARTDANVEDVNTTGNNSLLGWYSQTGQGEIGDLPINASGGNLGLVFQEVALADGSGTVPIQLMWSNADDGPAASTGAATTGAADPVQGRLVTTAAELVRQRNLRLSGDGMDALGELASQAAGVLKAEGKLDDDDAIGQATASLERLIGEIVANQPEPRRGAPPPPITAERVHRAHASLCPGLWPFC